MRVGTSLSRCILEIYQGKVLMKDVLVVISRTNCDPSDDAAWRSLWDGYAGGNKLYFSSSIHPEWRTVPACDEQKLRDVFIELHSQGKLHQPRQFGAFPSRMPHHWYDVILTNDVVKSTPGAERAWNNYKMIAGLS